MMNTTHECSPFCERPECIHARFPEDVAQILIDPKASTLELRAAVFDQQAQIEALNVRLTEAIATPATPRATWAMNGEPDPHGDRYNCARADLCMGAMTDDELANAAFMNYDVRPHPQDIIDGKAFSPIAYMTAVKDRIRWLSRRLDKVERPEQQPQEPVARILRIGINGIRIVWIRGADPQEGEFGQFLYLAPPKTDAGIPASTVSALREVARLRRHNAEWLSFAMKVGQSVGCLASSIPSANDHILRKLTHSNRLAFIGLQAWALENGYSGATDDEAYAAWLKDKETK